MPSGLKYLYLRREGILLDGTPRSAYLLHQPVTATPDTVHRPQMNDQIHVLFHASEEVV